jgi:PAS domain S-box-containing protein
MPTSTPSAPTRPRRRRGTARPQASRSSRFLAALLETAPEAVIVLDDDDRVLFANGEALRLWGAEADSLEGSSLARLFAPGFAFLRLDAAPGETFATEAEARRGDGARFTVRLSLRRMPETGGGHRALWVKPAGWHRAEAAAEDQRLTRRALETFSAGVAHDLNNVLTGVLGNLHLAREDRSRHGRQWHTFLDGSHEAALRGRELARHLLEFAHGEAPLPVPCALSRLARESAQFGLTHSRVRLEWEFGPESGHALADPTQIGQAIHQVASCVSAWSGPSAGGRLALSVRQETVSSAEDTRGGLLLPGDYVVLTLTAPHLWIAPADLARLFDPYAEVAGLPAGLKLASARALTERQNGCLRAEPAAPGIAFHFHLPACPDASAVAPVPLDLNLPDPGIRVLVMDDEQLVRLVLQRMLESFGHRVHAVADGEEAAEAYRLAMQRGERFDLVILDLRIPEGPGGRETCRRILELDPLATCVASSGSAYDDAMTDCHEHGFCGVLEKPFDPSILAALVHELTEPAGTASGSAETVPWEDEPFALGRENVLEVDFRNPDRY